MLVSLAQFIPGYWHRGMAVPLRVRMQRSAAHCSSRYPAGSGRAAPRAALSCSPDKRRQAWGHRRHLGPARAPCLARPGLGWPGACTACARLQHMRWAGSLHAHVRSAVHPRRSVECGSTIIVQMDNSIFRLSKWTTLSPKMVDNWVIWTTAFTNVTAVTNVTDQ